MKITGIEFVGILVDMSDFDKLNSLLLFLQNNETELNYLEDARKEFGKVKWTHRANVLDKNWFHVLVDRYAFIMLHRYTKFINATKEPIT